MKKSKYYNFIKVSDSHYAIFNSILFKIIFVDEKKLNEINEMTIKNLDDIDLLKENGIYVEDDIFSDDIFEAIKNTAYHQSKQVSIMYLNLSTHCNLDCKYCFIENNPTTKRNFSTMNIETAKMAVDKFVCEVKKNHEEESQIIMYGGEPLIKWNLLQEVVEYIESKEIVPRMTMITNGTLLDTKKIKYLKDHKIGVGISIDGPKNINDKNRIFRNSDKSVYNQAIKAINLLNEMDCQYCVSATATPEVVSNKDEVIKWIKDTNIKNIFWNLYHYSTKNEDWKEFYDRMSDFILSTYDSLEEFNVNEERVKEQINLFLDKRFKFHNCGAVGLNQITIQPNGDVCICQGDSRSSEAVIGNIINDEISSIINNQQNKQWIDVYTVNRDECRNCSSIVICGGGCPLQAEALFNSRADLDQATCIYYQKSLAWLLKKYYYATISNN